MRNLQTTHIPKAAADLVFGTGKDHNMTDSSTIIVDREGLDHLADALIDEAVEELDGTSFQPTLVAANDTDPFPIPSISEPYQRAPELTALAEDLLKRDVQIIDDMNWTLKGATVRYLWKQKGGSKRGEARTSDVSRLGGLARHYGRADFTVWIAVDHAKEMKPTYKQVRAMIFHELSHIEKRTTEDGEISHHLRNHDVEAFTGELELFGMWRDELRVAAEAFQQVGLWKPDREGESGDE